MLHDLRFALRSLLRSPGFTLVCVLMLAVGIGLSVYMFGAINAFALKPLPFKDADRLVHVEYTQRASQGRSLALPQADWLDLRARQDVLGPLAAWYQGTANLGGLQSPPERLSAAWISPDAFDVLGVQPALGRGFGAADAKPGAAAVALLGQRTWQLQFNADPAIIGRPVRINGHAVTVVGVMPEGFAFPVNESLWLPLATDRASAPGEDGALVQAFGRLREGVSLAQARERIDALVQTLAAERSEPLRGDMARVEAFANEFIQPQIRQSTLAMFVAVLLVLLIACTNVAALMTARFGARTRELAVRAALGASRRRLAVQIITEALVIAGLATALGWCGASLWVAHGGVDEAMADNLPYWVDYRTDVRDLLFAGAIAFLAALGAGLAPALRSSRLDVHAGLAGKTQAGERPRGAGRFLVSGEIALGLVLLVGAGATIKSALDAQHTDTGLRIDGVLTGRLALFEADYPDPGARARFARALQDELATLPGVDASSVASTLPLMGYERQEYARAGDPVDVDARLPLAWSSRVSDDFFATFGVGLREGRLFDARDHADSIPVAIVSAAFAAKAWPGQSAIGQRVRLQPRDGEMPWMEVVGVVADSLQSDYIVTSATAAAHRGDGNIYRPLVQDPPAFLSFAVHAGGGDAAALGESIRHAVRTIDPNLPVYWLRPMQEWRNRLFWGQDILARMFSAFAIFAVLLAAAGIHAVLAFDVAARTREIGVRRALGAPPGKVLALVLRRSARQVLIGLGIGLPLAFGFTLLLGQMLMPGTRSDPLVYLAVVATLALAVGFAAWLPAWRALQVEPMVALRSE